MADKNIPRKRVIILTSLKPGEDIWGLLHLVRSTLSSKNLVPVLADVDIAAIVSNINHGGGEDVAKLTSTEFLYSKGPFTVGWYQRLVDFFDADLVVLFGWLKPVEGLPACMVVNPHPAPLDYKNPDFHFGGDGYYGDYVYLEVMKAFEKGIITHTAVTFHFVIRGYDLGPIIYQQAIPMIHGESLDDLKSRVQEVERVWLPFIVYLVLNGVYQCLQDDQGKWYVQPINPYVGRTFAHLLRIPG